VNTFIVYFHATSETIQGEYYEVSDQGHLDIYDENGAIATFREWDYVLKVQD
jgi:hypothetical protein